MVTDGLVCDHFLRAMAWGLSHDDCTSKQFVNDVVNAVILATCWHEVPLPPLKGEVVER